MNSISAIEWILEQAREQGIPLGDDGLPLVRFSLPYVGMYWMAWRVEPVEWDVSWGLVVRHKNKVYEKQECAPLDEVRVYPGLARSQALWR